MKLKLIFLALVILTAIAAKDHEIASCPNLPPFFQSYKELIPMPRPINGRPVRIVIMALIRALSLYEGADEAKTKIKFYLHQEWIDPRTALEKKDNQEYRFLKDQSPIWIPDLFFKNNINNKTSEYERDTIYIKHLTNGIVHSVESKVITIPCSAEFKMHPFRIYRCVMPIESFRHPVNEAILVWNNTKDLTVPRKKLVPSYYEAEIKTESKLVSYRGADYSSPRIVFRFNKIVHGTAYRMVVPLCVITVCAFVSFFYTWEEFGARATLFVSTIIIYLLQLNLCAAILVSPFHLTSLDIWIFVSIVAVVVPASECLYIAITKEIRERAAEETNRSTFKHKMKMVLVVIILDLLSVTSVFLTRLL